MRRLPVVSTWLVLLAVLLSAARAGADGPSPSGPAAPLGAGFTYQGQLNSAGQPVSANCDMGFRLYGQSSGGAPVASVISQTVSVAAGLFTAALDFGASAFSGSARWLDITVRCPAGSGAFAHLDQRQALTAAPYALYALNNWALTGNAGTSAANFLGTTNNMTLTLAVSGTAAVRYVPSAVSPNIIGGYSGNVISPTVDGVTIAGGGSAVAGPNTASGSFATVSGGANNSAGDYATVGGGRQNQATNLFTTVGGGYANQATFQYASVGGGYGNQAISSYTTVGGGYANQASGALATVGGGDQNQATSSRATVGGGFSNQATSLYSTVGGGHLNIASGPGATVSGGGWDGVSNQGNIATGAADTIGGGISNTATLVASTVGGGSGNQATFSYAAVGGGHSNTATAQSSTVAGGEINNATGYAATVGGGGVNTASQTYAVVAGGYGNTASGEGAFIGGGGWDGSAYGGNTASGNAASVPGGENNSASGNYSFAAGRSAKAIQAGTFVWADSTGAVLSSTTANQFLVRASGGVTMYSNSAASMGVQLPPGSGSWGSVSDRNLKANVQPVDDLQILNALAGIPVATWNYTTQDAAIRHLGPMAQDFRAAFGLGENDTTISTVDAQGVALAGVQGLYHLAQSQAEQLQSQQARLDTQQSQIDDLQARLARLETRPAPPPVTQLPLTHYLLLFFAGLTGYLIARLRRPSGGAA